MSHATRITLDKYAKKAAEEATAELEAVCGRIEQSYLAEQAKARSLAGTVADLADVAERNQRLQARVVELEAKVAELEATPPATPPATPTGTTAGGPGKQKR